MTILIGVLILKLLNWIPSALQKHEIRKYRSVDAVAENLHIPRIYVPTYFPEHIQWPPVDIFAQRKPFDMIIMHFRHRDSNDLTLSIYQVADDARYNPEYFASLLYIKKESTISLKGREAELVLAVCSGHQRCNRLSWKEGRYRLTLISDDEPELIIKLAESMI